MSKYISKFSGYEVDTYISKIINGEVVLENTINEIEENKSNPVTSETLYNKFKDINDIFNIINKDIDIFKKQLDEILKGNVGLLSDIIGVDDNGDVYIKQNGDKPRNFYTYGTISFGGNSDNDTESTIIANLSDLLDVSLNNITNGQSLVYENGYWVNKEIKTGLTDEEINNMLNPINTRITNIENKINPLEIKVNNFETRLTFFENIIGVDETTGDVYIKKNGDSPRNFYTHGTISFGGLSIDEDVSIVNKISDLSDVFINNISANQILVWDTTILNDSGSYGAWVNKDLEQGLNTEELDIYLRSNEYVQKTYVDNRITDLINGAPAAYDTLKEIADVLSSNVNSIGDIMLTLSKKADKGTTLADYGITDALDNTTKYALADSVGGNALNALKLGGHESLYYATAVGLTEVSNRVKTLEDVIGIDDNGDVYIKKNNGNPRNFYTYGVISFNGLNIESGDYPSTGNITISVNGEEYTSTNGYIELPSYPTSFDWVNVENKPNFAAVATSGKYSDLSGLPTIPTNNNQLTNGAGYITSVALNGYAKLTDIPTSLPASDVYDWAKAASKPTYTFSEITVKPTTLAGYGITDALSVNGGTITDSLTIKNDSWTPIIFERGGYTSWIGTSGVIIDVGHTDGYLRVGKDTLRFVDYNTERAILHSANYANYALPLSGGTITGQVYIVMDRPEIDFYKGSGNSVAIMGYRDGYGTWLYNDKSDSYLNVTDSGIGTFNGNTLIHSGNIGSQSVNYANSANIANYSYGLGVENAANVHSELQYMQLASQNDAGDLPTSDWWHIIKMGHGNADTYFNRTLAFSFWNNRILTRNRQDGIASDWEELAFLSSNVASATKLQTGRYLWGNYFNGESDVNGKPFFKTSSADTSINVDIASIIVGPVTSNRRRYSSGVGFNGLLGHGGYDNHLHGWIGLNGYYSGDEAETYALVFAVNDNTTRGSVLTERMRIVPNGNVLIGTTSDNGYKLQVNGDISAMGGISSSSRYVVTAAYDSTNPTEQAIVINSAGYSSTYAAWPGIGFHIPGITCATIKFGSDTCFHFMNYLLSEWVNIKVGNLVATGTVAFGSDIRYKDIIGNINIDIETIANAPLFNYKWNDRDDKKVHLGTSAQYWYNTVFKNAVVATTDEKLWTMGYAEIALGNTITLAKELIPIKKEVNKIKVLEERIKKLENILIDNNIMFD